MQLSLRFNSDVPEGYQVWKNQAEVAGVHFHMDAARKFARGSNQSLQFERELKNTTDRNAIKVIGVTRFWFFFRKHHIGYVDTDLSNQIATRCDLKMLKPRLVQIWWSGNEKDFIVIRYQILQSSKAKWHW